MPPTVAVEQICEALASAPCWARLGLAAPDARCRERAGRAVAEHMVDALAAPPAPSRDPAQLPLSL